MQLSSYQAAQQDDICRLFSRVFANSEGDAEGQLIGELVLELLRNTDAADMFGFVATEHEQLIGGIFFTRLCFDQPCEAFILSPVAVHPDHQGKGLGQALIRFGLEQLRQQSVKLAFTYGDPAFYCKVGFQAISEALIKAPQPLSQPIGWLCQALDGGAIPSMAGQSRCVSALDKPEYW
jgi:predicted N-acetyltransferase YhbS